MKRSLAILLALAFAGCVNTPSDASDDTNQTDPDAPDMAALPAPIEASEQVSGSADPLNFAGQSPCASPTAQCHRYPFELNTTALMSATLTWTVPASDFDLYVFQDGAPIDVGGQGASPPGPPNPTETIEQELDEGAYELVVVPWSVAQDTFTLSATFASSAGGNETADTNESLW